jgi:hypothetical protein
MLPSKEYSRNQRGGHDFGIVHLTLFVHMMMYCFQQIVTQTERRNNFVVHGLAPPAVKWVISPLM